MKTLKTISLWFVFWFLLLYGCERATNPDDNIRSKKEPTEEVKEDIKIILYFPTGEVQEVMVDKELHDARWIKYRKDGLYYYFNGTFQIESPHCGCF